MNLIQLAFAYFLLGISYIYEGNLFQQIKNIKLKKSIHFSGPFDVTLLMLWKFGFLNFE